MSTNSVPQEYKTTEQDSKNRDIIMNDEVRDIFMNGRHYMMLGIINAQYNNTAGESLNIEKEINSDEDLMPELENLPDNDEPS